MNNARQSRKVESRRSNYSSNIYALLQRNRVARNMYEGYCFPIKQKSTNNKRSTAAMVSETCTSIPLARILLGIQALDLIYIANQT